MYNTFLQTDSGDIEAHSKWREFSAIETISTILHQKLGFKSYTADTIVHKPTNIA